MAFLLVPRAEALNLFLAHPSSAAHCPAGAAGPSQVSVTQSVSGFFFVSA